jgi:hypothetical protein
MNYYTKYKKYDKKINQIGNGGKKDLQFILFGDVMTGHGVWFHDNQNKEIDFVDKLEKLGDVIILKPNYVNFMNYSKTKNNKGNKFYKSNLDDLKFMIEDLQFENYAEWVYSQIDPDKKYIVIGLDQGCHFAKFFCNKYKTNCIALYILIDRNFTKKSYEKTFHSESNYDFIKSIVGNDNYEDYLIENLTNDTINDLLNKIKTLDNNEKYIDLLNGLCKGIIRSQNDKIKKLDIKTIIYSDSKVLTPEKIQENIDFNERSSDKIIYYYVIDDSEYLIHGKYANEIYNNIFGLVNDFVIKNMFGGKKMKKKKSNSYIKDKSVIKRTDKNGAQIY